MKAHTQNLLGTAVLGFVLCWQSLPAWAGFVSLQEVQVGTNSGTGSMTGSRYSGDNQQYIGCSFSKSYNPFDTYSPFITCLAKDKTGRAFVCKSLDTRYVNAFKGMTDSSHISFSSAPGTTACNSLEVRNSSSTLR